ncbi:MAG: hypothetical protein R3F61_09050 [Myxococcota bacterium]
MSEPTESSPAVAAFQAATGHGPVRHPTDPSLATFVDDEAPAREALLSFLDEEQDLTSGRAGREQTAAVLAAVGGFLVVFVGGGVALGLLFM